MQKEVTMKHHRLAMFTFLMLISLTFTVAATAGIEPSPFKPEINKLYASENMLSVIENVVTITIANPPVDGAPSPNLNGALNKLATTDIRVGSVSGFITSIYEEVMGTEPSPFRIDLVPAFEAVKGAAQDIVDVIGRYVPPGEVPSQFIEALGSVKGSAQIIVDNAQQYIGEISDPTVGGEADLVGTWSLNGTCLTIGINHDPYADGVTEAATDTLVIVWQENGLFKGYVCGVETPNGILFGTIDGRKITMTQWDAIVSGQLNRKGDKITFVSQHALQNPPSAPGTCIGVATKQPDGITCDPGPNNWQDWE
jgi:hypothetical protein